MNLKTWLKKKKMTQKKFASIIGTDQGQVSHLANGIQMPKMATIVAIEKATKGAVTFKDWKKAVGK